MKKIITILGLASLLFSSIAYSDSHEGTAKHGLFNKSFLGNLKAANEKIVQLAEAFSDEQYDWRPADGIRSVGESIMHIAGGNYALGEMLGKELPEGMKPWKLEKTVTQKDDILVAYKASIEFALAAIESVDEDNLATEIKMFGKQKPKMAVVLTIGAHANEHLGQLIAYARSTGVAPPWSK